MPIDPKDLALVTAAIAKANELYVVYQVQSGALNKAQEAASSETGKASGTLTAATSAAKRDFSVVEQKAQAAYNEVVLRAKATLDAAVAEAQTVHDGVATAAQKAYDAVARRQEASVSAASQEASAAERELVAQQAEMKKAWGLDLNLLPPPKVSGTFRR